MSIDLLEVRLDDCFAEGQVGSTHGRHKCHVTKMAPRSTLTLTNHVILRIVQAYVALSRARSIAGLRVAQFNPTCFKTNPKV